MRQIFTWLDGRQCHGRLLQASKQRRHDRLTWLVTSAHRYLSRDRNIVQFYGACVQSSSMLLVAELMEVSKGRRLEATHPDLMLMLFRCTIRHQCGCIARHVKGISLVT